MAARRTQSVPAVERAIRILESLASSRNGLTLSQITRKLGIPKSSTHCLLLTFERSGYLHRLAPTGRYMLGIRLFGLANVALSGITVREQAAPFLRQLMERTRLTVHMAVLEQAEAILIERIETPGLLRLATWIGKRMGLHCTALGKALIAGLPEEELDRLLRKHGMLRHNENTISSFRKLKQHLTLVRKTGYALDNEEEEVGIRCVGAPVRDWQDQVVAAISVSGTTMQINLENLSWLVDQVKSTAEAISAQMQFSPPAAEDAHNQA
jgi:DNA-binding IclR family transcriptional regulator